MNNKNLIAKIIFFLIGIIFFIYEARRLLNVKILYGPDDFLIYYAKMLFTFFALPIFAIANVLEFFGVIDGEGSSYFQIKIFYKAVYFIMALYIILVALNKIF